MVSRAVDLKMGANKWSVDAPPEMCSDCRDYISAVVMNTENVQRRSRRQWVKFRAQEDETLLDDSGGPLACPDEDRVAPPVPAGLAAHRPCFWLQAPCVSSAPKRERDPSPDLSDVTSDIPEPKRRRSEIQYVGQYRNAPGPQLGYRYSLELINQGPLWGYPSSTVLYGMETGSSLFPRPALTVRHEAGRDLSRPFNRGDQDPATLALEAIGAQQVPAEGIQTCTWNEEQRRIDITLPFKSRPELFRAYERPTRRVADGAAIHSWLYGTRLGPRAAGQLGNLV